MRILQAALMTTGLVLAGVGCTQSAGSAGTSAQYTVLDDQASQLRADFNRYIGSVRLLFVVDPICPGCLRGLADMNRDLLQGTTDPRLRTSWSTNRYWASPDTHHGCGRPEGRTSRRPRSYAESLHSELLESVWRVWPPALASGRA